MYRTILVPLDGTSFAERALPFARALAATTRARLLLLRVVDPQATPAAQFRADAHAAREAASYVTDLAARIADDTPVEAAVFFGGAARAITKEMQLRHADLVVMTIDDHPQAALPPGSVLGPVLYETRVPVLAVHAACARTWQQGQRPVIVVPVTARAPVQVGLDAASDLAQGLGAEVVLLDVNEPEPRGETAPPHGPDGRYTSGSPPEGGLDAAVERLRALGLPVSLHAMRGALVPSVAAAARETAAIAVVVVVDDGGAGVGNVLDGVTGDMMRHVAVPLLLVHARAQSRSAA